MRNNRKNASAIMKRLSEIQKAFSLINYMGITLMGKYDHCKQIAELTDTMFDRLRHMMQ
jgi:hypothetical protein